MSNFLYSGFTCQVSVVDILRVTTFELKIYSLVGNKNDLGKYFMQYVQNGQIINLTNGLKNDFCEN